MNSDNKQIRDVADVAARIMAGLPPIQEELKGGQTKLDVDKDGDIQADDLADLRAKKKVKKEEVEQQDEAMSHQAATTMKHIPNPSPALKKAAKDIKPGVGGYRDRIDMLKAGGVKEEVEQIEEDELGKKKKEQVVTVKHKDSGKELRVVKPAVSDYQKRGYHPVKEEIEQMDEVKMADLPSTKVQGRSYGASKPQPSAFDVLKGPKDKELTAIDAEKKKKKISEMIAIYKEGGLKTFFESIKKEDLIIEEPDSEQINELSTKTLAKAASAASDPDADYHYGKSHDPQKFADHAKKTKDAKSAAAVQGAADAKGHYTRPGHSLGSYDKLAHRTPARVTGAGKANKQDVNKLKKSISLNAEAVEQDIHVINADLMNGFAEVNIEERHMTGGEMNKREDIVKSMKKGMAGFKERYGDRAKNVMYATATKQAMKD